MFQEIINNCDSNIESISNINNFTKTLSCPITILDYDSRIERVDYSDIFYKEMAWADDRSTRRDLVVNTVTYRRNIIYDENGFFSFASDSVI